MFQGIHVVLCEETLVECEKAVLLYGFPSIQDTIYAKQGISMAQYIYWLAAVCLDLATVRGSCGELPVEAIAKVEAPSADARLQP